MTADNPAIPEMVRKELRRHAADALQSFQTWLMLERSEHIDYELATVIEQQAFNAVQRGFQAGLTAKDSAEREEIRRQRRAKLNELNPSVAAERGRIRKLLADPSDEFVERWSRAIAPSAWKKIDDNIADDDWNGGAALNLRRAILRDNRAALIALSDHLTADPVRKESLPTDLSAGEGM